MRAYHRMHERVQRRAVPNAEAFEEDVRRQLGVAPGEAWSLRAWSRTLPWGQLTGLRRVMEILIAVYEKLRAEKTDAALGLTLQGIKAVHQVTLDHGAWHTAWHMTTLQDPTRRPDFAGDVGELSTIAAYVNATADLKKKLGGLRAELQVQERVQEIGEEEPRLNRGQRRAEAKAKAQAAKAKADG